MKELEESKTLSTKKHSKSMSRESATDLKGNVKKHYDIMKHKET